MNRLKWLVALNAVLFFSMFFQILTGVILFFEMFASSEELISKLHGYNGFLLVVLVALHLAFNWGWIRANIFKRRIMPAK